MRTRASAGALGTYTYSYTYTTTNSRLVVRTTGGLVFFSFWVLLGSSGVPSGVLLVFFWLLVFFCRSSGQLLAFFW